MARVTTSCTRQSNRDGFSLNADLTVPARGTDQRHCGAQLARSWQRPVAAPLRACRDANLDEFPSKTIVRTIRRSAYSRWHRVPATSWHDVRYAQNRGNRRVCSLAPIAQSRGCTSTSEGRMQSIEPVPAGSTPTTGEVPCGNLSWVPAVPSRLAETARRPLAERSVRRDAGCGALQSHSGR